MSGNIAARRYARALFAIGQENGEAELKKYGDDLLQIAEALEGAPELMKFFRNPVFTIAEKKGVVAKVLAKTKPCKVVKNFSFLLADKNRLDCLPEIQAYFSVILDEVQGIVRGNLITAIDLTEPLKKKVKEQLEKQSGKNIVLEYGVDPDILGGLKLKVGDKVLDASIRAQLDILKENIKRGK
ncbi:ATP synthase F1 subunit delta [Desulfoplanes sp.]